MSQMFSQREVGDDWKRTTYPTELEACAAAHHATQVLRYAVAVYQRDDGRWDWRFAERS